MASEEVFEELRPGLTRAFYQILGSWADAEDIVQSTWLKWRHHHDSVECCAEGSPGRMRRSQPGNAASEEHQSIACFSAPEISALALADEQLGPLLRDALGEP